MTSASPGTDPPPVVVRTSRMASTAKANVPANSPMARWLGRSWRICRTMRGEKTPIANWTTTTTRDRTRPVRVSIEKEIR